jgi:hypothetical protein
MAKTFAGLLLEVRRRAASIPAEVPRPFALEQAVRELLATDRPLAEVELPRRILGALVGINEGGAFDAKILDSLSPEDVLRIDFLVTDIAYHGLEDEVLRAIRASLLRPAN